MEALNELYNNNILLILFWHVWFMIYGPKTINFIIGGYSVFHLTL